MCEPGTLQVGCTEKRSDSITVILIRVIILDVRARKYLLVVHSCLGKHCLLRTGYRLTFLIIIGHTSAGITTNNIRS